MSNINTRIVHKHDTAENWNKAENFYPLQGEIIIYDPDGTYTTARTKIGDGVHISSKIIGSPSI